MKRDVFVQTSNVTRLDVAMSSLVDTELGQPGMGVIQGVAGRGKTMASRKWHARNGGVFIRTMTGWTLNAMFQKICWDLVGERPNYVEQCRVKIMEELDEAPLPLIFDEADRLNINHIESLRDFHDECGVPIVLIGEEGFLVKLKARRRVFSRITEVVEFDGVSDTDIMQFFVQATDVNLAATAAAEISNRAGGSFRTVHNWAKKIEGFSKANDLDVVDVKVLDSLGLGIK